MPFSHLLLALLVAVIWGINFIFVKISLEELSPLLLCTVRFILASIPAVFFIKPPKIPYKIIIWYGLIMFALQFSLLFVGIHIGMTPGMASLIMQMQVFFSMLFASLYLKEHPNQWQIIGALVSFIGIGVVAFHFDSNISLGGFLCILAAAATWGVGNLITKKVHDINMMSLVVWGCLIASIPMFILSLTLEGTTSINQNFHHLSWLGIASISYIVYVSTWLGYGVWNWLLNRYPVGTIAPFTMLVPVVGMISSIIFIGEPFENWKLAAGLLVLCGLYLSLKSSRLSKKNTIGLKTQILTTLE